MASSSDTISAGVRANIGSAVRRTGRRPVTVILVAAALLLAGIAGATYLLADPASGSKGFPQSAAMEQQLGVRFSRVAVVGDGGLVTLSYVVIDAEKATRFQADTAHPPVLLSESRNGAVRRVSVMKQGHTLRVGATYYLVYQDTRAALRPGERTTIVDGSLRLRHVPVL